MKITQNYGADGRTLDLGVVVFFHTVEKWASKWGPEACFSTAWKNPCIEGVFFHSVEKKHSLEIVRALL